MGAGIPSRMCWLLRGSWVGPPRLQVSTGEGHCLQEAHPAEGPGLRLEPGSGGLAKGRVGQTPSLPCQGCPGHRGPQVAQRSWELKEAPGF